MNSRKPSLYAVFFLPLKQKMIPLIIPLWFPGISWKKLSGNPIVYTEPVSYTHLEKAINTDTIMVHIRKIREKIEIDPKNPKYLKVVWGVGYKMEKQ